MLEQHSKKAVQETFNTVAEGYDGSSLRFFSRSAANMSALLGLRGDEEVLDVACGTGNATLAIAPLLRTGTITAVDFSSGMLAQAKKKADEKGLTNIQFLERDMQDLGFQSRFDVAVCAFGIFFVLDMERQLAHIASTVKPGGRVMTTNFEESYFNPMREMFMTRLSSYGIQNQPQAWKRIAHEEGCRHLFESAGLSDIHVEKRDVGYHLDSADQWWDIVWSAGFRRLVAQLSPSDQEKFKREHLQEIEGLKTAEGIKLDVGVFYTTGTKR